MGAFAVNVAAAASDRGLRVLVVEIDPQADATTMLGVDPDAQPRTLCDVLVGECELPGAVLGDVAPVGAGRPSAIRSLPTARSTPSRANAASRAVASAAACAPRSTPPGTQASIAPAPPFYGSGRPLQTSIALDSACAARLDELARAAGVSVNALAVAALHAGLPAAAEEVREAIVDERVTKPNSSREPTG